MWRNKGFWSLLILGVLIFAMITVTLKVKSLPPFRSEPSKVQRIDPDALFRKLQKGEPLVIVDTRSQASFKKLHIKGAISIPSDQLKTRYFTLPAKQKIVLY